MKTGTLLFCAAMLVGGLATAAQDPKVPASTEPEPKIQLYRVDKLIGIEVLGGGDVAVGRLSDLIIDAGDGHIDYAVVSHGGLLGVGVQHCLVPWRSLYFSPVKKTPERCEVRTLLTAEQISACPKFKSGEPIVAEVERKCFDIAKLPTDPAIGSGEPARLVCASEIQDCRVVGGANAQLGKIERVLVDPVEQKVAYTVLDTGDRHVAVPWPVTRVSLDKERRVCLETELTRSRLESAPVFVKKDWKLMTSPAWLREMAAWYEVEPYWVRLAPVAALPEVPIRR